MKSSMQLSINRVCLFIIRPQITCQLLNYFLKFKSDKFLFLGGCKRIIDKKVFSNNQAVVRLFFKNCFQKVCKDNNLITNSLHTACLLFEKAALKSLLIFQKKICIEVNLLSIFAPLLMRK